MSLKKIKLDWEGFIKNLRREGTPERVFFFEHGVDEAIQQAIQEKYGIWDHLNPDATDYNYRKSVATHRFLGLELMRVFPPNARMVGAVANDDWENEGEGAISSWQDFEAYPWPDPDNADFSVLEYYEKNLSQDMRTFAVLDLWEVVRPLFGFESFCFKLYEDQALIEAVTRKVAEFNLAVIRAYCDFDCHAVLYLSDDLGFKSSTMLAPDTIRRLFMPWHKAMADLAHKKGKYVFFHSCGQMYELMDDYIDFVGIDAKHSFEEVVLPVTEVKKLYGNRLSLLGGVDVDLLARSDEKTIRAKTREILDNCVPGGGYFLGAGNWVTNYIPLENYITMVDEGRNWHGSQKT